MSGNKRRKASRPQIKVFQPSARTRLASSSIRVGLTIEQEQRRRPSHTTVSSQVYRNTTTEDSSRQHIDDTAPAAPQPQDIDDFPPSLDDNEDPVIDNQDGPTHEHQVPPEKPPPRPCQDWLPYRQVYVDELLRRDGPGVHAGLACSTCQNHQGILRCRDCLGTDLHCAECIIEAHCKLPFHRLLRWSGTYFEDVRLRDIGFRIVVGHECGSCPNPGPPAEDFTILDTSGIHILPVSFCECLGHPHVRIQLLRTGWLPATLKRPRTAFTFDCLETFQLLNLQGKLSAHDYCKTLDQISDTTSLKNFPDRYDQFLPCIRIWRHMKMAKRSGRGHDPEGIDGTLFGECALECPACPHPDINLPDDWTTAPEDRRWLYRLVKTIDANFKMKQKDKGIENDPPLGDGWAHWVANAPFKAYVKKYGHVIEPNICDSDLRATDHSNSTGKGLVENGVGGTLCRHTLVSKNGMGSLKNGERQAYMDFITFFCIIGTAITAFLFSYDIVCQWSRKLPTRIKQLPQCMQLTAEQLKNTTFVVPKLHLWGHGISCQLKYSLNFIKWSARTDGEGIERFWAFLNPLSMSTREMGAGARQDTIDDHIRWWNWRKIVGFGSSLAGQLDLAIEMQKTHCEAFADHNNTFDDVTIAKWTTMVTDWEADPEKPNPYDEPETSLNLAEVRLELAREEAADAARGIERGHDMTPSKFLLQSLDLEDQQRVLRWHASRPKQTTLQAAELQDKRNSLQRRINTWREVQDIYMPGVRVLRESSTSTSSSKHAETIPLMLPSALTATARESGCLQGLAAKEGRLRLAQADDALRELRRQLRVSAQIVDFKRNTVGGTSQRMATKTQTLMQRFHDKTHRCARRYSAAYEALCALDHPGDWRDRLRPLNHSTDLRLPGRDKEKDKKKEERESEGKREVSWIWLAPRREGDRDRATGDEYGVAMRVEWAKMRARAHRWTEEVRLTCEEMRRVVMYCDWKSRWWLLQRCRREDVTEELATGLSAYAEKQSSMYHSFASSFGRQWSSLLRRHSFSVDWPVEYTDESNV